MKTEEKVVQFVQEVQLLQPDLVGRFSTTNPEETHRSFIITRDLSTPGPESNGHHPRFG